MKTSIALLTLVCGLAACTEEPQAITPPQPTSPPIATASQLPPADPAPVTDGDITQMSINGMATVVKRIPGAELVAIQLYARGGVRNWSAADAGVEQLAFAVAATGGTDKIDRDSLARKLAALGSDLSGFSTPIAGGLEAKALLPQLDETFGLLCDAFLSPALPATEIELTRQRMLARLRHEQEDPDSRLTLLVHKARFSGHPLENRPEGTMESVAKLSADTLRAQLTKLREMSRLMLVVVGDVDPAHVSDLVKAKLGSVPRGTYQETPLPPVTFNQGKVDVVEAKLPTNYIQGVFTAPGWHDPDFPAAMVAMSLLGHRVFEEVRTKRNLSYAPSAWFSWREPIPAGNLYVTAVDPNATIKVMLDETKRLATEKVSDGDLQGAKSTFLTGQLMRNETTDAQAGALATAMMLAGDARFDRALPDRIRAVTAADLQAFAKKYATHLQFEILGDPSKVDKATFSAL